MSGYRKCETCGNVKCNAGPCAIYYGLCMSTNYKMWHPKYAWLGMAEETPEQVDDMCRQIDTLLEHLAEKGGTKTMEYCELHKRIKYYLSKNNMSQKDLSEAIGTTEVTVSRYVSGERIPKAPVLVSMAKAFNCSVDDLCGLTAENSHEANHGPMTGNEYQKLAMRTCSIPYENKAGRLYHAVFGLTSEAGEVAGILQKTYQGHDFDKEHMKKELGDCLWMISEACEALDLSLDDVMQTNIDKLRARYPEGFTAEKSLHRKEGDI